MPGRRVVAVAGMLLALGGLTGCEKPTPLVTVVSAGDSVHREATTFCFEGQSPEQRNCRQDDSAPPVLLVRPGDIVGIDVDKDLAESGWYVAVNRQRTAILDEHYFRFTPGGQDFQQGRLRLEIHAVEGEGDAARDVGVWFFDLVPR